MTDTPVASPTSRRDRSADFEAQRSYFATRRPVRMLAADTPYVQRHFDEVWRVAGLQPGEHVCEWGAGLGRFSHKLAAAGLRLDAIELSPTQSQECAAALAGAAHARVHTGDIVEVLAGAGQRYDAMVGFFLLHHLTGLDDYFAAAHAHLREGGRVAFTEPNPANPLYPVQLTFTPGMRWRNERGIYSLWPGQLRAAARRAGFRRVEIGYYGALPRAPYNLLARRGLERLPERLMPARLKPFQTIVAWR